eukprot:CAMPEP_0197189304 /NCGR_PEP_ID=MMETSP1423-20130617/19526_1 /TAXON_ID=476441 /ORGANISM="Pseudo-nitzschia heimii, Strain UNC1101" /LENGTH=136 /DNA_ID=CAMNT_0042641369 /DNA_START=114 /DNA_END=521 /DNA_ORIENTATION=-
MEHSRHSTVILTLCTVSSVVGFGPQLEPLSHSNCCAQRAQTPRLHASKSKANNGDDENESSMTQTSDFHPFPTHFDGLEAFSFVFDHVVFDGTFPVLQEQARALALETFEETQVSGPDDSDDCGDDCKECEIPNDW